MKDADGGQVVGASVMVKGTKKNAMTDLQGKFSLDKVKKGDILVVSSLGYKPVEVAYDGNPIDVTLVFDDTSLEEVVVVGYGVQKKV